MEENYKYKSCRISNGSSHGNLDFDFDSDFEGCFKVVVFFKWEPPFLLLILVAYLESFPKYYNKVFLQ